MNEILQKRIEEKSKELGQMFFPDNMNVFARPNWEAGYIETACKEIANFALQNQWISVDEALPDASEYNSYQGLSEHVFAMNEESEDVIVAWYDNKSKNWYQEWNGGERVQFEITHWMSIPSSEGGEK